MKNEIIKVHPNNEEVFLKKSKLFGWGVVYPFKNENESNNWFNILTGGTWSKLIVLVIIILMICGFFYNTANNINALLDCFRVPGMLDKCIEAYGTQQTNLLP